jgi:hypothetical protein
MFLEYAQWLGQFRSLNVSLSTIHNTLIWGGLSIKHVQKLALEQSNFTCVEYLH